MQPDQRQSGQQREVRPEQHGIQTHNPFPRTRAWLAGASAAALLMLAGWLVATGDLRAHPRTAVALLLASSAVYGVLVWSLAHLYHRMGDASRGRLVGAVVLFAMVLRAVFLLLPPTLSDDVYRYRWDGKVQAAGLNPYLEPPAAPSLEALRDPQWSRINYPRIRSIYPPLAQLLFAAVYHVHHSVLAFRAAAVLGDLLVITLLLSLLHAWNRPRWLIALYACHPLPAVEFASSGHFDAWAVALLLAAILAHERDHPLPSTMMLAGAVLLKTWPLIFVPLLLRRRPRWHVLVFGATLLAGFLPYLGAGTRMLQPWLDYAGRWRFNDGAFYVLRQLISSDAAAKAAAAGLGAALFLWIWQRRQDPVRGGYWLLVGFIVLMPTVHPWYLLWALPLAAAALDLGWITLCSLAPAAYWILVGASADSSTWLEPTWPRFLEYLPALAIWIWQSRRSGVPAPGRTEPLDDSHGISGRPGNSR